MEKVKNFFHFWKSKFSFQNVTPVNVSKCGWLLVFIDEPLESERGEEKEHTPPPPGPRTEVFLHQNRTSCSQLFISLHSTQTDMVLHGDTGPKRINVSHVPTFMSACTVYS